MLEEIGRREQERAREAAEQALDAGTAPRARVALGRRADGAPVDQPPGGRGVAAPAGRAGGRPDRGGPDRGARGRARDRRADRRRCPDASRRSGAGGRPARRDRDSRARRRVGSPHGRPAADALVRGTALRRRHQPGAGEPGAVAPRGRDRPEPRGDGGDHRRQREPRGRGRRRGAQPDDRRGRHCGADHAQGPAPLPAQGAARAAARRATASRRGRRHEHRVRDTSGGRPAARPAGPSTPASSRARSPLPRTSRSCRRSSS